MARRLVKLLCLRLASNRAPAQRSTEAGLIERAVGYWHKAGQQAIARSAMAEAVAQLTKGLQALQGLPDGSGRDRRELDLQALLGMALNPLKGQAAPDTGRAYARARDLCRQVGDTEHLFPVVSEQWSFHLSRAAHAAAPAGAEELLRLAQGQGNSGALMIRHRMPGPAHSMFGGWFRPARTSRERLRSIFPDGTARSRFSIPTTRGRRHGPAAWRRTHTPRELAIVPWCELVHMPRAAVYATRTR